MGSDKPHAESEGQVAVYEEPIAMHAYVAASCLDSIFASSVIVAPSSFASLDLMTSWTDGNSKADEDKGRDRDSWRTGRWNARSRKAEPAIDRSESLMCCPCVPQADVPGNHRQLLPRDHHEHLLHHDSTWELPVWKLYSEH